MTSDTFTRGKENSISPLHFELHGDGRRFDLSFRTEALDFLSPSPPTPPRAVDRIARERLARFIRPGEGGSAARCYHLVYIECNPTRPRFHYRVTRCRRVSRCSLSDNRAIVHPLLENYATPRHRGLMPREFGARALLSGGLRAF